MLQRIDWRKHSWIKVDSDTDEDQDLYFKDNIPGTSKTRKNFEGLVPVSKSSKSEPNPEEIDTDDEIAEALNKDPKPCDSLRKNLETSENQPLESKNEENCERVIQKERAETQPPKETHVFKVP